MLLVETVPNDVQSLSSRLSLSADATISTLGFTPPHSVVRLPQGSLQTT